MDSNHIYSKGLIDIICTILIVGFLFLTGCSKDYKVYVGLAGSDPIIRDQYLKEQEEKKAKTNNKKKLDDTQFSNPRFSD